MRAKLAAIALLGLTGSSCALVGLAPECDGFEIIGKFEQVGDLVQNANVQSADVVIGRIQNIELDDWTAKVTMCINEGQQIPQNSEARVRTTSLLGEKFVDLRPRSFGPPYLAGGDVLEVDQTSKATELEEIFAQLASILGAGNLEQLNRFTAAQADILRGRADDLRRVLRDLREFTDLLAGRNGRIAAAVDSLGSVSRTVVADASTLERFLQSFAGSSGVLEEQKEELQNLLLSLDRFSDISVQLLTQTERGLNQQFSKLRPVLRTLARNSEDLIDTLRTLATFSEWFPETMPGDYLQLDVCQAAPDQFGQGEVCPQAVDNDDPKTSSERRSSLPEDGLELILRRPLEAKS